MLFIPCISWCFGVSKRPYKKGVDFVDTFLNGLIFTDAEKCPQHHGNDWPQNQAEYADALEAEIHGKQGQQGVQSDLRPQNLGL